MRILQFALPAVLTVGLSSLQAQESASQRRRDLMWICTVRVTTDANGKVIKAEILKSSGNKSADELAAKNWLRGHGPPNSTKTFEVKFRHLPKMW